MNKHYDTACFWCKKPMHQREETYKRQMEKYGHNCCKSCFGNEQSFKDSRSRVMTDNNPFKGKTHSAETRKILARNATGRTPWNKGNRKKRPPAIPGSVIRWMKFKKTIIKRDCGGCWKCNSTERIEVHHIASKKRNPKLYYNRNNCITLCHWCHKEFHKKYGRYTFEPIHTIQWLNEGREEHERVFFC